QPPLATGADGRFLSREMPAGAYTFNITAQGYNAGSCTAMVQPAPAPPPPMMPGPLAPGQFVPPPPPAGPQFVDVDCELEALPKNGNVLGSIRDAAGGGAVGGAVVKATDAAGKEVSVT